MHCERIPLRPTANDLLFISLNILYRAKIRTQFVRDLKILFRRISFLYTFFSLPVQWPHRSSQARRGDIKKARDILK